MQCLIHAPYLVCLTPPSLKRKDRHTTVIALEISRRKQDINGRDYDEQADGETASLASAINSCG